MNCEAYSTFEGLSPAHRIVTAKIRLSLRTNTIQANKTTHYDWSLNNNNDIFNRYKMTQGNKFDGHQEVIETLIPNDEDVIFVNSHVEA